MIVPFGSRVVVDPIKESAEYRTAAGLFVADGEFQAPQSIKCKVLAIGPDVTLVKVGDTVLASQFAPTQAKEKPGDTTVIIPEEDLLAVVRPDGGSGK